jgi:hypothetical protein
MKDLEKYIDIAKEAKLKSTPFSNEDVRELLKSSKGGAARNSFKNLMTNHGRTIIMSSASLLIVAVAAYFFGVFATPESEIEEQLSKNEIQVETIPTKIDSLQIEDVIKEVYGTYPDLYVKPDGILNKNQTSEFTQKDTNSALTFSLISKKKKQKTGNPGAMQIFTISESSGISNEEITPSRNSFFYPTKTDKGEDIYLYMGKEYRVLSGDIISAETPVSWNNLEFYTETREPLKGSEMLEVRYKHEGMKDSVDSKIRYSIQTYPEDYLRIYSELETELDKTIVENIKKVCLEDNANFFTYIDNVATESATKIALQDYDRYINEYKKIIIFGYLTQKYYGSLQEKDELSESGIALPVENLKKLGVVIGKDFISIPNDIYQSSYSSIIMNSYGEKRSLKAALEKEGLEYVESDESTIFDYPLIKKHGYKMPENENGIFPGQLFYKDLLYSWTRGKEVGGDDPEKAHKFGWSWRDVNNYKPANSFSSYRKYAPAIIDPYRHNNNAMLYFSDEPKMKELYELYSLERSLGDSLNYCMDESDPEYNKVRNYWQAVKASYIIKKMDVKGNLLVPVDIRIPFYDWEPDPTAGTYDTVRLWYYPNEEFLSALPNDIRYQLEEEMELAEKVKTGDIAPQEACDKLGDRESILGLCSIKPPVVTEITVAPNPTATSSEITFELKDRRYIKLLLLDSGGNYVKEFNGWDELPTGKHRFTGNFSDLRNGSYMLVLITEQGEKYNKKIVIEK